MLDYGAKAQMKFDRNKGNLANKILVTDDDTSPYYYNPSAVTAETIGNTGASDMSEGLSSYGLVYQASTIVYLSETSIRHYYTIEDQGKFDLVKNNITFNGKKVNYTVKGNEIYYELKNISADDLDKLFTLTIGEKDYKYSVLDYVKACLASNKTGANMKALAAATYWYNQAANDFFV